MPLFAKKFRKGSMYFWQSVYNYDLGGSQIKKDYFWHTNPKIEKRSTWNFSSNHFEHRLLGTMTTSNWRKKRNFAGSCCCLLEKNLPVPKLYILSTVQLRTALYSVLSHCTTVHYSQQTLSLLSHSTNSSCSQLSWD